jgi:DNA-binding ferritin-like protein
MNEFIATLFLTRELAHRYHLSTKSYSQHKALQNFYEDLLDLTDDLAEMTQGAHGLLNIPILTEKSGYKEPLYCIADKLKYVENNRYKAYSKEDTALQNKIDEIVETFLRAIYKLENLK